MFTLTRAAEHHDEKESRGVGRASARLVGALGTALGRHGQCAGERLGAREALGCVCVLWLSPSPAKRSVMQTGWAFFPAVVCCRSGCRLTCRGCKRFWKLHAKQVGSCMAELAWFWH